MGYFYGQDDGPIMCFNAAKSYQLGWYADRHQNLSPSARSWNGRLVGVAQYGSITDPNDRMVVRFNAGSDDDFYFAFDRQVGITHFLVY
jgi:hypothetical protein